tara:strand:- start:23295 stop:23513 length:219 start_codon:yes stop_codon:yes gene_type:complete
MPISQLKGVESKAKKRPIMKHDLFSVSHDINTGEYWVSLGPFTEEAEAMFVAIDIEAVVAMHEREQFGDTVH